MRAKHQVIYILLVADKWDRQWRMAVDEQATAGDIIGDCLSKDGLPASWRMDYFLVAPDGDVLRWDELVWPVAKSEDGRRTFVIGHRPDFKTVGGQQ